jgi:hypothetical protein
MKNLKLFLIVTIPALLCLLYMFVFQVKNIFYFPLIFCSIISVSNGVFKKSLSLSKFLLFNLLGYLVMFLSILSYSGLFELLSFIFDENGVIHKFSLIDLSFFVSVYAIAPALLFYLFSLIYKIKRNYFSLLVIISTIILLLTCRIFILEFDVEKVKSFTLWQIVMAFGLQLIVYQKEIFNNQCSIVN